MPHRGAHCVTLAKVTTNSLRFGRRFHNYELSFALLHLLRFRRRSHPRVRFGSSHFIKFRSTYGTRTNRDRRTLRVKTCHRVLHLTLGLTFHAICFHTLPLSAS